MIFKFITKTITVGENCHTNSHNNYGKTVTPLNFAMPKISLKERLRYLKDENS